MIAPAHNESQRKNQFFGKIIQVKEIELGSFTLEASLVFPFVLLSTIAVLFFSLYLYHRSILYHTAATTADRLAYAWNNSHKDYVTGAYSINQNDGLYWRLKENGISGAGFINNELHSTLQLPLDEDTSVVQSHGSLRKMKTVARLLPKNISGKIVYSNQLWTNQIRVELQQNFHSPLFVGLHVLKADASSHVVDPVELIRTVDLVREYIPTIKEKISVEQAKKILEEPEHSAENSPVKITSEAEASEYLRKLTGGHSKQFHLNNGNERLVDAMDSNLIAHQAFYTFTEKQLRENQMLKDTELLQSGNIAGVVWHFFLPEKREAVGPSTALRRDLERNGIVIVIHD